MEKDTVFQSVTVFLYSFQGHAPTFQLVGPGSIMTGLPCFHHEKFMLKQFHFHFGHTNDQGTEHAVNGKRFAVEVSI